MNPVLKEIIEWIYCFIVAIGVALVIRYYLITPTVVKQSSMYPTLQNNERLILSRTFRISGLKLDYEDMKKQVVSIEDYYKELKKVSLKKEDYTKYLNGVKLKFDEQDKLVRVYSGSKYSGLGEIKDGTLKRYIVENEGV